MGNSQNFPKTHSTKGAILPLEGKDLMFLTEVSGAFAVTEGTVDIFAQIGDKKAVYGPRRHLFRVSKGDILFGFGQSPPKIKGEMEKQLKIIAVGGQRTKLVAIKPHLTGHRSHNWVEHLVMATRENVEGLTFLPKEFNKDPKALEQFHQKALKAIAQMMARAEDADAKAINAHIQNSIRNKQGIYTRLYNLASINSYAKENHLEHFDDPLLSVCFTVAKAIGVKIILPKSWDSEDKEFSAVLKVAQASHLRVRQVNLTGEWWRTEAGPLIAWRGQARSPVALIPLSRRRYQLFDPLVGKVEKLNKEIILDLAPEAAMFYQVLPPEARSMFAIFKFGFKNSGDDLKRLVGTSIGLGLLSLVAPLTTGLMVNTLIPNAGTQDIVFMIFGLLVVAVTTAAFQIAENIAALRLESRLDARVQAAIVDRILRLPTSFFRRFTSGDLANRILGFARIRDLLAGRVLRLLFNLVTMLNLGVLFWYSASLAWIASGFIILKLALIILTAIWRLKWEVPEAALQGKEEGLLLQFFIGIGKLKVAGAVERALNEWSQIFAEKTQLSFKSQLMAMHRMIADTGLTMLATLTIFAVAPLPSEGAFSTGALVAFLTAFALATAAVGNLGTVIAEMLGIVPIWKRLSPVLAEKPEVDENREQPGILKGGFEVDALSFRYSPGTPPALVDISLKIEPGENVAIVGPSGAGKSTLFRLLLGFETPDTGQILLDGKNIEKLDLGAVRRQIGVVMQQHNMKWGNVYETIAGGGADLPIEDAWKAARLAGIEEDIRAMPMEMETVLFGGVNPISVGQHQRLMIARALAYNPKILLFDEATSALDNLTQERVMSSLSKMGSTRVFIAHRLSTVRDADRIIVFDQGRIQQQGTFKELSSCPGLFKDLIKQQLL